MFFIKSGSGLDSIMALLPGVVAISILFGTTSMLAVTVTFEKRTALSNACCLLGYFTHQGFLVNKIPAHRGKKEMGFLYFF